MLAQTTLLAWMAEFDACPSSFDHEEIEGGHGASVTNEQLAHRLALAYTHLWMRLGGP